jgi:hypothetical protein
MTQETIEQTRKKLKEIYSFTFEKKEKNKQTETKTVKNQDTGEDEEVSITKEIEESVPYRVVMKKPSRRQIEEAELEFSVEMSKCIKNGILTKAMLAKKYSDTGGLLAEEDAKSLTNMYIKYGEMSNEIEKLQISPESEKFKNKIGALAGDIALTRKDIINIETSYANLFNHTADMRAENKVIQWYILNLTHIQKGDEDTIDPLFPGKTFDHKLQVFYDMEEEGDEIYDIIGGKVAALFSFWYYSSGSASSGELASLSEDIDLGNI